MDEHKETNCTITQRSRYDEHHAAGNVPAGRDVMAVGSHLNDMPANSRVPNDQNAQKHVFNYPEKSTPRQNEQNESFIQRAASIHNIL